MLSSLFLSGAVSLLEDWSANVRRRKSELNKNKTLSTLFSNVSAFYKLKKENYPPILSSPFVSETPHMINTKTAFKTSLL